MASTPSDGLDLSQFYDVFFDEAGEHLAGMESLLLGIDVESPDEEQLNAIFRAAHSIKGGAATFGFSDITELTHEMETVFDRVRKHIMPLTPELVDVFLASGDMLMGLLAARRTGTGGVPAAEIEALCVRLRAFLEDAPAAAAAAEAVASRAADLAAGKPVALPPGRHALELVFGPIDAVMTAAAVDGVIADLKDFGTCEALPARNETELRYRIITEVSLEDMRDAMAFMVDPDRFRISAEAPADEPAAAPEGAQDEGFGLFETAVPAAPQATGAVVAAAAGTSGASAASAASVPPAGQGKAASRAPAAAAESASIRVDVEKIDQLINLVGELVITQAMLAQTASKADAVLYEALTNGLAQLERNTRDLQESAMSIRMMPMSFAFSRFPRVVRDVAAKLGKEVELVTTGENTELDKGLIERIVDPLTHLVRNSLDHGLETPDERVAAGKPRKGTVLLAAYHQGGNIVIEVSDDGRGLRRDKILAKARERGMHAPDSMADGDVWNLIFEAGFSTADVVTDVSGRGVGMDVVRRNIKDMGGRVDITSNPGRGTRMTIRLPLTLAILDGMSVRVGDALYILPLGYIVESMQPAASAMRTIGGSERVIEVRGEYLPILSLRDTLGVRGPRPVEGHSILVILEAEGGKTALEVDGLVGQHQVVIKSLEANYRRVPGISGATIMGDGRVALILDAGHLVGLSRQRVAKAA
jgi:two-component system chemotaxis sensor kinase CheA